MGLFGCFWDIQKKPSFKQQMSVSNAKCATAAAEFNAATTDEEKLKVAADYFSTAPKELQLMDDTIWGRDPSVDPSTPDATNPPKTSSEQR